MLLKQVLDLFEVLDTPQASGETVKKMLLEAGADEVKVQTVTGDQGSTDCIKVWIYGRNGKHAGGTVPTLGIIGRLGGLGARPEVVGFTSDGDGALAAMAAALKLAQMHKNGDVLEGDVILSTHICPDAPTQEHFPVPFMDSPIDMELCNRMDVDEGMDAILSIDTTKGNRIINHRGFAISPTVKEGYILRVSEDLLDVMISTTGRLPHVFALSQQDITPYGNGLYHLNSILQPATATKAPVVGVAVTTETTVAGCATGATHLEDLEDAGRFMLEAAKAFGNGLCSFYDEEEFGRIQKLYGSMEHFQTLGKQ